MELAKYNSSINSVAWDLIVLFSVMSSSVSIISLAKR